MAEKYFNLDEAERLLTVISPHLEKARDEKKRVEKLNAELAQTAARIMVLGGSIPPLGEVGRLRSERDRRTNQIEEAVSKIHETGCIVKDLEMGLVDFPSVRNGQEVYLCWKLGEERIGYWHGLEEGFAGRKPLREDKSPPPQRKIQ